VWLIAIKQFLIFFLKWLRLMLADRNQTRVVSLINTAKVQLHVIRGV
jgi:hypothetical protein